MKQFVDDRDDGPIILSHFSLLLACAMPLWVCDVSNPIQMLSGVLVIGIGDAFVGLVRSLIYVGCYCWNKVGKEKDMALENV